MQHALSGVQFPLIGSGENEAEGYYGSITFIPMTNESIELCCMSESERQSYEVFVYPSRKTPMNSPNRRVWVISKILIDDDDTRQSTQSSLKTLNAPSGKIRCDIPPQVASISGASLGVATFVAIAKGCNRLKSTKGSFEEEGFPFVFTGFLKSEEFSNHNSDLAVKKVDKINNKLMLAERTKKILFFPKSCIVDKITGEVHDEHLMKMLLSGAFYTFFQQAVSIPYSPSQYGVAVESLPELLTILAQRESIFKQPK